MKLIHCADMHLDSALATSLTRQEARRRNDELFETFIKMMDYAQREKVRAVLVAGDLFDSENGREAVKKKGTRSSGGTSAGGFFSAFRQP